MVLYKWFLISFSLVMINIRCYVRAGVGARLTYIQPIQGGGYTKITEFPHSVFLHCNCKAQWACGGSLLTQNLILTAAHCLDECTGDFSVLIYAGAAEVEKASQVRQLKRYVMHRDYDPRNSYNDIALVQSRRDFALTDTTKRVIILRGFSNGVTGYVAGWGVVNSQGEDPEKLKFLDQNVESLSECDIYPGMMCGRSRQSNSFPDRGDSGSAFVIKSYIQIGLVSFRYRRDRSTVIYTNVSYYYDWIKIKAKNLVCYKG